MSPRDVERLVDACLLPGFGGGELPEWVRRALEDGLAGVALYGANLTDGSAVRRLSAQIHAARPDAVVALDEEGGDVTRLDYLTGSRYPGNLALGTVDDEGITVEVARAMGADLRAAGVDVDFAPVVDVNSDPENPVIGVRSFGSDPALVSRHGAAFVHGLQSMGVAAVVKHFPGHGATRTDSHLSLPVLADDERTIRERDLPPFVAAIAAGARGVMTGHLLLPAFDDVPATLSRRLLTGLLRQELGFDGVVVTDALDMAGVRARHGIAGAAVLSLIAGADLLLLGAEDGRSHRVDVQHAVLRAVREGDLPMARLADAARRVGSLTAFPAAPRRTGGDVNPVPPRPATGGDLGAAPRTVPERDIGAEVAGRALSMPGRVTAGPYVVAELRGSTNLAVGNARWSLADPLNELGQLAESVQVTPTGPTVDAVVDLAGSRRLVVAVRDAYRSDWQRAWVAAALERRPDLVLVSLGMPPPAELSAPRSIAAHGAGRANTAAAARALAGR